MKKLTSIFFIAILFISAGCKKSFFDINDNPSSPVEQDVTPQLILPSAMYRAANKMAVSYGNYAGWMGYWARSGTYGPNAEEESYNITTGFESDEWGWYDILYDFDTMEKKAAAENQGMYVAIAKIMKTIGFMYLVDQYNNVPYTQAFQITKYPTPEYTKGADIYADLFKQLDAAVELLKAADVDKNPGIEDADVVYHGHADKWLKLANTQRLKLLIHTSEVTTDADAKAQLAKVTSDGYLSNTGVFGTATEDDNAYVRLSFTQGQNKQNPFWNTYEQLYTGDVANQFWRANNYLLKNVYGWSVTALDADDPRLFYVFDEADSRIGNNYYYGYNYGEVIPNSDPFKAVNSSNVAGPGLAHSASQPQWFFTVFESLFLQAEAAERGWITADSKTLYESAIRASFTWLGATTEEADGYIENSDRAAWTGNKIRLINFQKYIALAGVNNFEAWVDYRRLDGAEAILTDLPLSLAPGRGSNQIPLRIIYPQSEYNYNAANVGKEGAIRPQTNRIFWDKGAR